MLAATLAAALLGVAAGRGVAQGAAAYEIPPRGMLEFEREVLSFDLRRGRMLADIGVRAVPSAAEGGCLWRYRQGDAKGDSPPGWSELGFDDSGWAVGRSAFASEVDGPASCRWQQPRLWLRRGFRWEGQSAPRAAVLVVRHDDDVAVHINGSEVFREAGAVGYATHYLPPAACDLIVQGDNVLAAQATNNGGPAYADVGLVLLHTRLPSTEEELVLVREAPHDVRVVQHALFSSCRAPAVVFAGELDEPRQRLALPPKDLRDVAAHFALDLRHVGAAHSFQATLPRLPHFGDLLVKGKAEALADGRQVLRLALRTVKPALAGDDKRYFDKHVAPHLDYEFAGEAEVWRRVEAGSGAVTELDVVLRGEIAPPGDGAAPIRLELCERWQRPRVRLNRDPQFRADVARASALSADWIAAELEDLTAKDLADRLEDGRTYNSGRLALALLALVRAGRSREDPVLAKGFAELRRRKLVDTYSLANAIMAMEASHAPNGERDDLLSGVLAAPRLRQLPPRDRALVEQWTAALRQNVDSSALRGSMRFNYFPGRRFDNSVHQYGLLGLYSAQLCGIETPAEVWRAAAQHLLDAQEERGPRLRLQLTGHTECAALAAPGGELPRGALVQAKGWAYQEGRTADGVQAPRYGAMTAAALTGLTICQAALRALGERDDRLMREIDAAVESGFAWLARELTVRWHPGWVGRTFIHHYYYLYSLERACELSGIAWIQGRDWYHEGAVAVMSWQRADGSFASEVYGGKPLETASMALLFLAKSALPVYTRR